MLAAGYQSYSAEVESSGWLPLQNQDVTNSPLSCESELDLAGSRNAEALSSWEMVMVLRNRTGSHETTLLRIVKVTMTASMTKGVDVESKRCCNKEQLYGLSLGAADQEI